MPSPALVVWFCGLPGSGKSSIAKGVQKSVAEATGRSVTLVSMDSIRKKIFPKPEYTDQERDIAYRSFVLIASLLSNSGVTVLLDGTGHRRVWRDLARQICPRFVEVYVKCPIEICIDRETKRTDQNDVRNRLYVDALDRLKTGRRIEGLGKVPGVDEPFEESRDSEVVLDSSSEETKVLVEKAIRALSKFEPELFRTD